MEGESGGFEKRRGRVRGKSPVVIFPLGLPEFVLSTDTEYNGTIPTDLVSNILIDLITK